MKYVWVCARSLVCTYVHTHAQIYEANTSKVKKKSWLKGTKKGLTKASAW